MTDPDHTAGLRDFLYRAQAANRAAQASLAVLDSTLEKALERGLKEGLQYALKDAPPISDHRRNHRPGRQARLAADPELRAFVEARFGSMTFDQITAAVAEAFASERQVRRSAIHSWWTLYHKPARKPR